jgi:hypothetical protein
MAERPLYDRTARLDRSELTQQALCATQIRCRIAILESVENVLHQAPCISALVVFPKLRQTDRRPELLRHRPLFTGEFHERRNNDSAASRAAIVGSRSNNSPLLHKDPARYRTDCCSASYSLGSEILGQSAPMASRIIPA